MMSYDVSIGDFDSNMTYNVGKLFYDHIPNMGNGGGLRELNGKTGAECVDILQEAFVSLRNAQHALWKNGVPGAPEFCAKYDPPNGWGSTIGAITWLGEILAACAKNRRKRFRVS